MEMFTGEMWTKLGSTMASIMFIYAMFQQYVPHGFRGTVEKYFHHLVGYFNPNIQIRFHEFVGERLERSEAYTAIQTYLSGSSSKVAKRLKADIGKNSTNLVLSMDDYEEVPDEYKGVKVMWAASKNVAKPQSFSFYPTSDEKRYYNLTFHRRYREQVINSYLSHVLEKGKAIALQNRQRRLYTNSTGQNSYSKKTSWSHVVFDHPATFRTLAMETDKKNEIIDDLITFSKSKEYYAKIGKAWKRGYLLYGPPGTGKSTMIAAMANLLNYDLYDLELTAVKDNTELRKLLIETSSKSIIVIEDIDCSLDLTGQRKKKKGKEDVEETDPITKRAQEEESPKDSKVTLSGLLNFIDGIWSACGGERIIVFTTNHIEQLDPALIRRGRMDKHIELSYCSFEGFKVLARNYLDIDSHALFEDIKQLLKESPMTPADVAENLMLTTFTRNVQTCLENLIQALKTAKGEAKLKAEKEEAELKAKDGTEEGEQTKLKTKEEKASDNEHKDQPQEDGH